MPDISQAEAISKAIVRESLPTTPVTGSNDVVAAEMIRKADDSNWREGLTFSLETRVTREEVLGRVDQIGSERDASGKRVRAVGSPEEQRFQSASKAAELALKFQEKGYEGLTASEKTAVRKKFEGTILQNPGVAVQYRALDAAGKQAFLERYLGDNAYTKEVSGALKSITEGEIVDDTSSEKQNLLDQAATEQAVKQSELEDVQRRLKTVDARIKEFDNTSTPPGAKSAEMDRIRGNLSTLQAEAATHQQEMDDKTFRLGQLQQERQLALTPLRQGTTTAARSITDIDADVNAVRGELKTATSNFNAKTAEINKLPQLEQEQQRLEEQRLNLSREESEKRIAKSTSDVELTKAQRNLQDALDRRQRQEEDIARSLDSVFSTATMELIDKEIDALGPQFEASLKQMKEEAMSSDQKAAITALEQRWVKVINKRRFGFYTEPRRVIDKARVNMDFNTLMAGGTENYMRDILSEAINPATNNPYTATEIDGLLKNEDFVKATQPESIKQLIARKAVVGGIDKSDVYSITHSSWGEEVIGDAIKTNEAFRKSVQSLMGAGALEDPNFMQRLANEAENHPSLFATLVAALVAGATVATGGGAYGGVGLRNSGKMFG